MSRDDSILYSGATSASLSTPKAEELKTKRAVERQERREDTHKLKPAADIVLELIDKHRNKVKYIGEFEVEKMITDEHFKSEVMARKKFYQFLNQFEQEIKNKLREVPEVIPQEYQDD